MRYVLEAMRPILIDLLSTIVFFILLWTTHDFILATALGIAAGVAEVSLRLIRRKPVGVITWMSLGLVVLMGSASILTHNPLFVMLKPTIAYSLVGLAMLKRGWISLMSRASFSRASTSVSVGMKSISAIWRTSSAVRCVSAASFVK